MFTIKTLVSFLVILALKTTCTASTPLLELYETNLVSRQATATVNTDSKNAIAKLSWPLSWVYSYFSPWLSNMSSIEPTFDKQIKKDHLFVPVSNHSQANMHTASTLLVSCIDFRLRDETAELMEEIFKLTDQYDEVAIPGSSLALVAKDAKPHWGETLKDIISLASNLHKIERVIFLDHRECGAYKIILGDESVSTHDKETKAHKKIFKKTRKVFAKQFPDLKVYTLLMGLDGKVEIFK